MGKRTRYPTIVVITVLFLLPRICPAATYRVGPGEEYARVSEIAGGLRAGDVVEVTGNITDSATISASGFPNSPINVRGVTQIENNRILRPHIRPDSDSAAFSVRIAGDWISLEGLGFADFRGREYGKAALVISGSGTIIRNCYFHHNLRSTFAEESTAGNLRIEFCEFESNGYGRMAPESLMSRVPGATVTVENCYFHSNVGNHLLRVGYAKNIVRYNWFEDPCHFALHITTAAFFKEGVHPELADKVLPEHSDIVGNVFLSGWGSNTYGAMQVGGGGLENPGPEGDFNIAHNLFLGRRGGNVPYIPIATHGNVDRIKVYNNLFIDCRNGGLKVYERDENEKYDTTRTRDFAKKVGREIAAVEGSNNWVSESATGIPESFIGTIRGTDPGVFSFTGGDFRPVGDSPLTGKGLWPLPEGRIVSLVPEYEPQRGIPIDLKPKTRKRSAPPSIGPFEAAEESPGFRDDSASLVLGVKDVQTDVQWELDFGGAHRKALEYLSKGDPKKALECAKMQYILSPRDERTFNLAVESVKQMLVAVDANDGRASKFDEYVKFGEAGSDGLSGTRDDIADPIADVPLEVFRQPREFYDALDRTIDARIGMCVDGAYYAYWWETRWYRAEKAYALIQGAEFERALPIVAELLAEGAQRRQLDKSDSERWRTKNLTDRATECLTAIARGRGYSPIAAEGFAAKYLDYASLGAAGRDGVLGTSDDIAFESGAVRTPEIKRGERVRAIISGLKGSGKPVGELERKLDGIEDAARRTAYKLRFIGLEAASRSPSGFAYCCPTAKELADELRGRQIAGVVGAAALTAEESDGVLRAVRETTESSDAAVVGVFSELADFDLSGEGVRKTQEYITAYLVGTRNATDSGSLLGALAARTKGGVLPVFIVWNTMECLDDPFLAVELFEAIDGVKEGSWPEGERDRALTEIESRQYTRLKSVDGKARALSAAQARALYATAVSNCGRYLKRFPASANADSVRFQCGYYRYLSGDLQSAAAELRGFVASRPHSPFVPPALLYESLALLGMGEKDAALSKLKALVAEFPQSSAAPQALFVTGGIYLRSQDYERAADCFRRIVDFHPGCEYAREAREFLRKMGVNGTEGPR